MPIVADDLKPFSAASVPEDDVSTSGGAIDLESSPDLTQLGGNSVIAIISDGADTRTATITGRLPTGAVDTEAPVLNGTTEVVGSKTFERFLKLVLSATDGSRTVTVKEGSGGATRATIGPNETTRHLFFQKSASESSAVTRYEKKFFKNTHGSITLTEAKVELTADPVSKIEIGVAASKDDSGSVTNRKTAPGGITFVDDNVAQDVPNQELVAGEAIGVWIKQSLGAGDTAQKTTFTTELAGNTT
ncbi:MAG: hypothetical protein NOU37_09290 [Candidatus Brocadiales bacterium]|nr:hypothetical protein [Candidatus Bathyanammoxibius amoris]